VLFQYPIAATSENWVHDCLREMVRAIHSNLAAGTDPVPWPAIIPAAHRTRLRGRVGLHTRLDAYASAVAALPDSERQSVLVALDDQNDIAALLSCTKDSPVLDDLPAEIRAPIKSLYDFGFGLLSAFGVRDRQYAIIYSTIGYHVCPFCGYEYFTAPRGPREALDHYLVEQKYPFAAANLRNLAPMGNICNSRYKLAADILRRDDGSRRRSFDPYNSPGLKVSLNNSVPNTGLDGPLILIWAVDFSLDNEETETWESVFSIRERYERDVLRTSFQTWLWEFRDWCRSTAPIGTQDVEVIGALDRYAGFQEACGLNDRAFLKGAFFRMLLGHCELGNRRLLDFARDLVRSGVEAAA